MSENTKKSNWKQIVIALVVLAALIVGGIFIYSKFGPQTQEGTKSITIEVIDNNQKSTVYELNTDAKYLQQAMDEAEGLTYSGSESEYGLMVDTINGITTKQDPTSSVMPAYWIFYVNGEYCNYGIQKQPVADGDHFQIIYESLKDE